LPSPLLTNELYTSFIAIWEIKNKSLLLLKLRDIIWLLPDENRQFLFYIVSFLAEIASHSEQNKMNINNLVTIFGPLLLRCDQVFGEDLIEISTINNILTNIIQNRDYLFAPIK